MYTSAFTQVMDTAGTIKWVPFVKWVGYLVGLVGCMLLTATANTLAQSNEGEVEEVYNIYPSEWGVPYPAGLAYARKLGQFLLVNQITQRPISETTIVAITPYDEQIASVTIPFAQDNAINLAFDDQIGRAFLLGEAQKKLAQIKLGSDGILDPTSLVQFDVSSLGLIDAQGMSVDAAQQQLYILDDGSNQVVRIPLTTSGINQAAATHIDLVGLAIDQLRGIALHPQTHHLFVGDPSGDRVYEILQNGQLLIYYNLGNLSVVYQHGLAFGESPDLTDPVETIRLFIADSNLLGNASTGPQATPPVGLTKQQYLPFVADSTVRNNATLPQQAAAVVFGQIIEVAFGCIGCSQAFSVSAQVETEPVHHPLDAADDPAIWMHPTYPSLSTIIATDKRGGLVVYDLQGHELQYLADGALNNVDVRDDFAVGGRSVSLVAASNRVSNTIALYQVDGRTRRLSNIGARALPATMPKVIGLCLYHSQITDKYYAFITGRMGHIEQWELFDNGAGQVDGTLVRTINIADQSEGCVADDELGDLYVASERVGIRKFKAEADGGSTATFVDSTGFGGYLTADVEGLAIYYGQNGAGYLLASSQGSSEFVIYQRRGSNEYVGKFKIGDGNGIDGVSGTDGIAVCQRSLGAAFPHGIFVAQDGLNDVGNQNFKIVPWQAIAGQMDPPLLVQ